MSAEVAVLAPMAAEGAIDTRQAPARTETVRGKEKGAERDDKGARYPNCPDGNLLSWSHSQEGRLPVHTPALRVVDSPSKIFTGQENWKKKKKKKKKSPEWN